MQADSSAVRFQLDAGNLLRTSGSAEERRRVNRLILELLAEQGLDFGNETPGDRRSRAEFAEAARPSGTQTGVWHVISRDGLRLALLPLGEIGDSAGTSALRDAQIPPAPAADLRAALVCTRGGSPEAILAVCPPLDLLIVSHGDTKHRRPHLIGPTLVVDAPPEGQYLGRVRFDPDGAVTEEWLSLFGGGLTRSDVAERIATLNEELQELRKTEARRRKPSEKDARWVTTAGCRECHGREAETWERSGHAHALQTLVKAKKDFDPDCLRCHVTAWEQGFVDPLSTPELVDVQCEACHGPGRKHAEDPGHPMGRTARDLCRTCHTPENSPEYAPDSYLDRIRHW